MTIHIHKLSLRVFAKILKIHNLKMMHWLNLHTH